MISSSRLRQEEEVKFSLRIPKGVYGAMQVVADNERRSVNSLIVRVVEQWVEENYPVLLSAHTLTPDP